MAAVKELLIDAFVATTAIASGEFGGDDESVMVFLFLACGGLVAVETVDALAGVGAHFIFVDHGILCASMALGAFAGGANEIGTGLVRFDFGAGAVQQEGSKNQGECDDDSEKYGAERHDGASCGAPASTR